MPGAPAASSSAALQRRVGDAEVEHRLGVLARARAAPRAGRRGSPSRTSSAIRSTCPTWVIGMMPGMIGTSIAGRARARDEVEVEGVVEEHLRDQEVHARVDLLGRGSAGRPRRSRRGCASPGSTPRRSRTGSRLPISCDELARVLQAALGLRPVLLAVRRIAAQREHVVDAGRAHLVERRAQLGHGGADAGEVRHRLQAELVLDALDDLDRLLAGRAARAVGDRHERRLERLQLARARAYRFCSPASRLRREELEGEDRLGAGGEDLVDAHGPNAIRRRRSSARARREGAAPGRVTSRCSKIAERLRQQPLRVLRRRSRRRRRAATISNAVSGLARERLARRASTGARARARDCLRCARARRRTCARDPAGTGARERLARRPASAGTRRPGRASSRSRSTARCAPSR